MVGVRVIDSNSEIKSLFSEKLSSSNFIGISTGYYSYRTIEIFEKELRTLTEKKGELKLIIGQDSQPENIKFFSKVSNMTKEELLDAISENYFGNFINISNSALECAFNLFDRNIIQIKIGISRLGGIFHVKNYIFESEEEKGYIIGSLNLSEQALISNYEMVNYITNDIGFNENKMKFNKLWDNAYEYAKVEEINSFFAKKSKEELKKRGISVKNYNKIIPHDYQLDAINELIENDFNGFLEMATGTGKTFTTLLGLDTYLNKADKNYFTLIVVPLQHLVTQWKSQIEKVFGDEVEVIECYSGTSWRNNFDHKVSKVKRRKQNIFCLMVQKTLFNNIEIVTEILESTNNIFIVDEAHNLNKKNLDMLIKLKETFSSRLGLSATPENYLDDERTELLFNFFSGAHYIFELKKAIERGFLTEYQYNPYIVKLDTDEEFRYKELTRQIKDEKNEFVKSNLLDKRSEVLSKARNKINSLISVMNNLNDLEYTLVYCNPGSFLSADNVERKYIEQISIDLEEKTTIKPRKRKITSNETVKQRNEIVGSFERKDIDMILAIKCLDEGYDIPAVRNAFILHSTRNPSEFIQRRGRVLRKFAGKNMAYIYDFIVEVDGLVPDDERERFKEYYKLSNNEKELEIFKKNHIGE